MTKLLKKIVILTCSIILLGLPTATAYAASTPVLVINSDGIKYYSYQPYYVLNSLTTTGLDDITNQECSCGYPWTVTAGKKFRVQVTTLEKSTSLQITIISCKSGVIYNDVLTTNYSGFNVDIPVTSDDSYCVWVTAQYTPVTIIGYGGYLLDQ